MKAPPTGLLWAAAFAAIVVNACSSGNADSLTGGLHTGSSTALPSPTSPTPSAPGSTSGGDSNGQGPTEILLDGGGTLLALGPPPAAGPGSVESASHQYFTSTVYPLLAVCQACHQSGANGAPKMMETNATTTYQELDARGLIQLPSLLLTKGTHAGGLAPSLTPAQQQAITTWLGMEAQERQGKNAPTNVLADLATCMDETQFKAIGLDTLRTKPRQGESANKCTGCNNEPCRLCHGDPATGFYMTLGTKLGTDETFAMTQKQPFLLKYFGLNGTAPAASNAIATKSQATQTAKPYTHPMFTIPANVQTNLDAFVAQTIQKYSAAAGACSQAPDAGAPAGDAGN